VRAPLHLAAALRKTIVEPTPNGAQSQRHTLTPLQFAPRDRLLCLGRKLKLAGNSGFVAACTDRVIADLLKSRRYRLLALLEAGRRHLTQSYRKHKPQVAERDLRLFLWPLVHEAASFVTRYPYTKLPASSRQQVAMERGDIEQAGSLLHASEPPE
jgi:hypothetical protein